MRILIKILGDKPVNKIGVTDVNKLIDYLVQKKKKNSTINSYKGRLETTLREMVQAGYIEPLIPTKNLREGDKDIHILNADMEEKLINKFKELDFLLHKQISLIGLETGLRWCEMFEVRKRNIDLNMVKLLNQEKILHN